MSSYCQLWLTCSSKAEANKIASALLEKHMIACAKQMRLKSDFLWKGKVDHNDEILLVMDSREDLFEEIEGEVATIHSYETFVLQAIPIVKISKDAAKWLKETITKS